MTHRSLVFDECPEPQELEASGALGGPGRASITKEDAIEGQRVWWLVSVDSRDSSPRKLSGRERLARLPIYPRLLEIGHMAWVAARIGDGLLENGEEIEWPLVQIVPWRCGPTIVHRTSVLVRLAVYPGFDQ